MKVRGRERVGFNFLELAKKFISNSETNNDEVIEQEVKKVIDQQNNDFIKQLEQSTSSIGKANGGKRNEKMNIKATKAKTIERSNSKDRNLEERERD